jgi:hypothetical protein
MSEPNCPKCSAPMRLMRVVPSILPPETGGDILWLSFSIALTTKSADVCSPDNVQKSLLGQQAWVRARFGD